MLIDTNVYSALNRGDAAAISALSGGARLHIPVVVIGELRYGFIYGSKQEENDQQLSAFLARNVVEVVYITQKTAAIYGEMAAHCRRSGRVLSDNDLWIAALAQENDLGLVTFDRDFTALSDILGERLSVLG